MELEAKKNLESTEQIDALSFINGINNKENETITLNQNDLDASFKLNNLKNCTIYLNGKLKALFMNTLTNCKIFVGIVEGATFFDKIENCEFHVIAHQIRIHNTRNSKFFLFVTSKPIIEHSTGLSFSKYAHSYADLDKIFKESEFDGKENLYYDVQDFNWLKQEKSPNFTVL